MTSAEARFRLRRLEDERRTAVEEGLTANTTYMSALLADVAATRTAYVGLAVTEAATAHARVHGRNFG